MHVSDKYVQDFSALWKARHPNDPMTEAELLDMATHFLRAVELVYRPLPGQTLPCLEKLFREKEAAEDK